MRLPNGFGNVSKLPGNRRKPYRARITVGWEVDDNTGTIRQQFKTIGYYETKQEGLIALSIYHQNPYDMDSSKITFKEIFEKWSAEHYPKISDSNVKGYNAAYRSCVVIENMRFVDIKKSHLQGVIDDSGKNYPTMKKIKSLFNQLYKFAMQNDLCSKDYSKYIDIEQYRDKNPNAYNRKPFSKAEVQRVWDWKDTNEYFSVILMLIYTGVRIGELLDLKKENVNLSERWFDVTASKTEAGIRKVPIAEKIVPFFEYWISKNDCEYVLSTPDGKHFEYRNYYDSYWMPLVEQMGMQHRPHDTRHTCISLLTVAGVQDKVIKKIVGHKGQSITEIVYTHFEIQELIDAINKI
ncbi:MAG: site-specific integrase [Oscillospiraceae bacterium]|nr:site-specific integrase [Oscillospiraceae bacterium]